MLDKRDKVPIIVISIIGIVPVIWLGLIIAPHTHGGLAEILPALNYAFENPFDIKLCEDSMKTVLICLLAYGLTIGVVLSNVRNYRKGEEHGSAKWGDVNKVNKKYQQKPENNNKIMTQNVAIGFNGKKHRRNLNTVVIGGSGSGKTLFYAKPNLMQCNCSYVVTDPKGEILRDCGGLLKENGYKVLALNLKDMEQSNCYNPFVYLKKDDDVQKLVTNLYKSTTPKDSTTQDPFWDGAAKMLLFAIIYYLWYEAPEEEQNFEMVMEMLRAAEIEDEEQQSYSAFDVLFKQLETKKPNHIAVNYYRNYHSGSNKTLKSIQITLAARLEKFNLKELNSITCCDELDFEMMATEKVALFAVIPDDDTSFNFLVSILYTQLFQRLNHLADMVYKGALPMPVHFCMDEFANVALPDDFEKNLSVMRSRGIFVSIILQNVTQLKALFEKQWESIIGNCDELLYLGGNEQSTHEYISKLLGKETIDTNTYGKSMGRNGNYSTNYQITGRELMTPDEVRMLDNKYCLLFIRGERPIKDLKYNTFKHPNFIYTEDGGATPYIHNTVTKERATITIIDAHEEGLYLNIDDLGYELLSEEQLQKEYKL